MSGRLALRISRNKESTGERSANYDVHLNDWKLGRGVHGIKLDMSASERPKLIIECDPDVIEIDDVEVEAMFRKG